MPHDDRPVTSDDCLRTLALKGMATAETVAASLGTSTPSAADQLAPLTDGGLLQLLPGDRLRLTDSGRARVDELFTREMATASAVVEPLLDELHPVNVAFKELVTEWQTTDGGRGALVDRLAEQVHPRVADLIARGAGRVERLARYRERLEAALARLRAGDEQYLAHPLLDSYHTVWFELHEELIRLAGRDRASEAAAGRA